MPKLPLTKKEIEFVVEQLRNGQQLPEDLQYKLFPVKQKEYELVYGGKMRKEDILANEDGVFPVPLQVEKVFNGNRESWSDGWSNMIVFGDNLQFLKTVYENKDPLIKDKVKGKVKLIYIDPPFGTGDEYDGKKGQRAYSARVRGAEFVEFIRRRLVLAKELLTNDGTIYVRQDYHFGHYTKIILDEVFGKDKLINEIIINRISKKGFAARDAYKPAKYPVSTDILYVYSKTANYLFEPYKLFKQAKKEKWHSMDVMDANPSTPKPRIINGKTMLAPQGRKWMFSQENIYKMEKEGLIKFNSKGNPIYKVKSQDWEILDTNWTDIPGYSFSVNYPTENSETLLERVIESSSNEEDIVLDFFAGSGTTASVAEKLNRKWIVCDIGKLSFYTIQKRILNIQMSKNLKILKERYEKNAKTFIAVNTGYYNLDKIFTLKQEEYKKFVTELFEVDLIQNKKIGGIPIAGQKNDGYFVIIYPYWEFKDAAVDEEYLEDLHSHIGKKIGNRLYIISPANYIDFISDYYEIDKVRYYFLKVPYQIIKELHKVEFKKFRQPQSKSNVNDLDDAVGFHFMRQPKVKSILRSQKSKVEIHIKEFYSDYTEEETGNEMENYESLAMVLIDKSYNGDAFEMDEYFFAEDLLPKKKKGEEENIKEELKKQKDIIISINKKECGGKIMVVYIDIYGNEFKEALTVK